MDGFDALGMQTINPPRSARLFDDQARVFKESQVPRYRRSTDWQRVGNLANGYINAFNFETGAFRGTLKNRQGQPIQNAGLWALTFGNGSQGFNPHTLYFDAGIDNFQHGLFGAITPGS